MIWCLYNRRLIDLRSQNVCRVFRQAFHNSYAKHKRIGESKETLPDYIICSVRCSQSGAVLGCSLKKQELTFENTRFFLFRC